MNKHNKTKRGFTLIELLVVIAIIAILMVAVVITLNPSELLKQSRDSNRLSDMATLKTAISLYQADVATTTALATTGTCYASATATTCVSGGLGGFITASAQGANDGARTVGGAGWVPLNFNLISSGAPITQLPIDPLNTAAAYFYGFEASGTALFKLTMKTESTKFTQGGTGDVESTDGGTYPAYYETGSGASVL